MFSVLSLVGKYLSYYLEKPEEKTDMRHTVEHNTSAFNL